MSPVPGFLKSLAGPFVLGVVFAAGATAVNAQTRETPTPTNNNQPVAAQTTFAKNSNPGSDTVPQKENKKEIEVIDLSAKTPVMGSMLTGSKSSREVIAFSVPKDISEADFNKIKAALEIIQQQSEYTIRITRVNPEIPRQFKPTTGQTTDPQDAMFAWYNRIPLAAFSVSVSRETDDLANRMKNTIDTQIKIYEEARAKQQQTVTPMTVATIKPPGLQ